MSMVRIVTVRYNENLKRFPEHVLRDVTENREVLSKSEFFFMHGNVPHLALVLELSENPAVAAAAAGPEGVKTGSSSTDEVAASLPPKLAYVFRTLVDWRKRLADAGGLRAYHIASNKALVNILNIMPKTKDELLKIPDVKKGQLGKHADGFLRLMNAAAEKYEKEVKPKEEAAKAAENAGEKEDASKNAEADAKAKAAAAERAAAAKAAKARENAAWEARAQAEMLSEIKAQEEAEARANQDDFRDYGDDDDDPDRPY